mgnify:CR=1 FL=1
MKKLWQDSILAQSMAVRTPVMPPVRQSIADVKLDYDSVTHYTTNIIEWLKPTIDLTGWHVYPTNGITEGLNWWMAGERRTIHMYEGDYQWIQKQDGVGDIFYVSCPSAIDGNWPIIPTDMAVALDLAYLGSTAPNTITVTDNIERVFYSLSKPFGIRNVRTGWMLTRAPEPRLEALIYNGKYYNYIAHGIAETIINQFSIDYIHQYLISKQTHICDQLQLTPSATVWLANTDDDVYAKFRRSSQKTARVCLSGVYNYHA